MEEQKKEDEKVEGEKGVRQGQERERVKRGKTEGSLIVLSQPSPRSLQAPNPKQL